MAGRKRHDQKLFVHQALLFWKLHTASGGPESKNLQWDDVILIHFPFLSVIDIQAFERLLGPCMDIMKRNISQYEDQLVALFGSSLDLKH